MLAYITMLMLTVVLFVGLVIDAGMGIIHYRVAQNTADASALGAAEEISLGGSESDATTMAQTVSAQNGYAASALTLVYLDANGSPTTDASQVDKVRATVQKDFLLDVPVFSQQTISIGTHAAAAVSQQAPCVICVLNPSAAQALNVSGTAGTTVSGGGVAVDSSASNAGVLTGGAHVTADSVGIVGSYTTSGGGYFSPTPTQISPVPDPLSRVPVPPTGGQAQSISLGGTQTATISQGVYQSISLSSSAQLTLNPGIYIITGSVSLSSTSKIMGNGVMLYFTCGAQTAAACSSNGGKGQNGAFLSLTGSSQYQLTAPTSGPYKGLTIFYDRNNTSSLTLTGTSSDSLTGTIYAKSAPAKLTGGSGVFQVDSLIVVDTLTLTGSAPITIDYHRANNYAVGIPGMTE